MTNYDKLQEILIKKGMDKKWSRMFVKKLSDDEKAFSVDEESKKWALERGFFPGRVLLYGLNQENYSDYLPDYNYFMIHPINHHFRIWVNDKLTLKYVLNSNGCEDTMPEYYLYVENNGNYTYLMDCPEDIKKDENFVLNLLKKKGVLAIKPNSGTSGGLGFIKLELRGEEIYSNNKKIPLEELKQIISSFKNTIVTQYVRQHSELAKVWPDSECTLRVIMAKIPGDNPYAQSEWECLISFARFGASISGGTSNLSSGGVGVGFDFETGKYKDVGIRYKRFCQDGDYKCDKHPDTGVIWRNSVLPNWDKVKQKICQVCRQISSLDYLGLDLIITEDGFKFCEINTHPASDYAQVLCAPVLRKSKAVRFFKNKGLFGIDSREFYSAYLESQI